MRKLIDLEADVFGFFPGDMSSDSQESLFRKSNLECVDLCFCFNGGLFFYSLTLCRYQGALN